MIRATFKWLSTGETGTILQWEKPGVHLTPYHLSTILNTGFSEFFPEETAISCSVEKDGAEVAAYLFIRVPVDNTMIVYLKNTATDKVIKKYYSLERCL